MTESDTGRFDDPAFQRMLKRRGRLRWTFSGVLIGSYLLWGVLGVYQSGFYAAPLPGTSMPKGVAMAFAIILASIVLAVIYVRIVNRMQVDAERGA